MATIPHLLVEVGAVELLRGHVHGRPVVVGRAQVALRRVLHPADAEVRHLPALLSVKGQHVRVLYVLPSV